MAQQIKTAAVSIDIGENIVKIIQTNSKALITHAGTAPIKEFAEKHGSEYETALTTAIKSAAQKAGIRGKRNCVIITGDPYIIINQFVWPKMPNEALALNARAEITPYLPGDVSQFTVSHKIIGEDISEDGLIGVSSYNVLVAALPTNQSESILAAAKKAGFTPKNLALRETARQKFTLIPKLSKILNSPSFAVLDISNLVFNMTMFINGRYYANRYFNSFTEEQAENSVTDNAHAISEISSIIDYIHYRERGSNIGSIVVCGDTQANSALIESLKNELSAEIHTFDNLQNAFVSRDKQSTINAELYADAYGAAVADTTDIDLFPKKKEEEVKVTKKNPLPAIYLTIVLFAVIAALIVFPALNLQNLKNEEKLLAQQMSQLTISEGDVQRLIMELAQLSEIITAVEQYTESEDLFSALQIMTHINSALTGGVTISDVDIKGTEITMLGYAGSPRIAADYAQALRGIDLFETVLLTSLESRGNNADFRLKITRTQTGGAVNEDD